MIARLIISPILEARVEAIKGILQDANISESHPDLLYFSKESKLGIAEARIIKEHFSLKPYSTKGRVVVLEDASLLTPEAQNALLKTLEEPPKEAILILGAPSESKFLPTILSRCQIIRLQGAERVQGYEKEISNLMKATIAEKFEFVEKLKDKEEFLHFLMSYFHKKPNYHSFLKELLKAEEWASHNVNIRAILEYLMLTMPQNL